MWKYALSILTFIAIVFSVSCNHGPGPIQVNLDEEFTLMPAHSAQLKGEDLKLEFKGVTEDSRCPSDVTCIWEGQVVCDTVVEYDGSLEYLTLIQPGLTDSYTDEIFNQYLISFKVTPYPNSEQQISPDMYRVNPIHSRSRCILTVEFNFHGLKFQ